MWVFGPTNEGKNKFKNAQNTVKHISNMHIRTSSLGSSNLERTANSPKYADDNRKWCFSLMKREMFQLLMNPKCGYHFMN